MKRVLTILFFIGCSFRLLANNEIGPEGHKLVWLLVLVVVLGLATFLSQLKSKSKGRFKFWFPVRRKVNVDLRKDRLYYPRFLELSVVNQGKTDVDIDSPVLVLSSIWVTRRFKLKGTNKNWCYPLYLTKNQSHTLNIDLHRFYGFDRTLKRLPRARVVVKDVKGRQLGSRKVLLRKTLFNF